MKWIIVLLAVFVVSPQSVAAGSRGSQWDLYRFEELSGTLDGFTVETVVGSLQGNEDSDYVQALR